MNGLHFVRVRIGIVKPTEEDGWRIMLQRGNGPELMSVQDFATRDEAVAIARRMDAAIREHLEGAATPYSREVGDDLS